MPPALNAHSQPVGHDLPNWTPRQRPPRTPMQGRYCRLEPLSAARHAADLFDAFSQAPDASDWTYMSVGPFADAQAYLRFAEAAQASDDPLHHAVIELATGCAIGSLALMRVDTASGVMEVGFVCYSRQLKRTRAATELLDKLLRPLDKQSRFAGTHQALALRHQIAPSSS